MPCENVVTFGRISASRNPFPGFQIHVSMRSEPFKGARANRGTSAADAEFSRNQLFDQTLVVRKSGSHLLGCELIVLSMVVVKRWISYLPS